MTVIITRNKPRRNLPPTSRDGIISSPNSVRAYRQSPEDICLQLRRERDYMSISLTFEEAWKLIDVLLDALPPERKEV